MNDVVPADLGPLLSAFDRLLTIEAPDALLRRAVELARDTIGLVRVSIYVLDQSRYLMLGTWGSDSRGAILDEHHVMHAMGKTDREALRCDEEGAQYAVFENCLIVEQRSHGTKVEGRGWVACTPIRCGETIIGMMFNDAGPARAAFDQAKQAEAAILCSLLGTILSSLAAMRRAGTARKNRLPVHRLVMASVAMLAQDPGIGTDQIARQLAVSPRRLAGIFESSMGVSLVNYRNRARLDRLALLIARGRTSLPDAAIAAGFESYAQCQRVFRTFRWMALLRG